MSIPLPPRNLPLVSVIVLNYNGRAYIADCLNTVLKSDYPNFEVVLVDNNSSDDSLSMAETILCGYKQAKVVRNALNVGYAAGNNLGAKNSEGRYLAFLNFDTEVDPGWLKEAVASLEEEDKAAIAQCKILLMDNKSVLDNVGHYIDSLGITHFIGRLRENVGLDSYPREIFGAYGAAFIIKSDVFNKLQGFDSDFFILFEESDLCWRAWVSGYKVIFSPHAIVFHKGGVTYSKTDHSLTTYFFARNRLMSMLKNYEGPNILKFVPINVLLMVGTALLKLRSRNTSEAVAILNGLLWNLRNLDKILVKRNTVGRLRTTSNDVLLRKGIIKKFDPWRTIRKARDILGAY